MRSWRRLASPVRRIVTAVSPVFVDVDTGVDDALALVYLLASDVDLVGVASTGETLRYNRFARTI